MVVHLRGDKSVGYPANLNRDFCQRVPAKENNSSLVGLERIMSKLQALLETLMGAAELNGNRMVANNIREDLFKMTRSHEADGYQRLARAASEPKHPRCKAA
jgi:hypothetical protein